MVPVVDAPDDDHRAEALNQLLTEASTYPRMTNHTGEGWHLHYRDDGVPLAQVLRAITSVGTALHLAGRGHAPDRPLRPPGVHQRLRRHLTHRPATLLLHPLCQP